MADTLYKVNVKFHADVSDYLKSVKHLTKEGKTINLQNAKMSAVATKQQKAVIKLAKDSSKHHNQVSPKRSRELKEQSKLLQQQNKELKEQLELEKKLAKERGSRGGRGGGRGGGGGGGGGGGSQPRQRPPGQGIGGPQGWAADLTQGILMGIGGQLVKGLVSLISMPFQAISGQYEAYRSYAMSRSRLAGYAGGGISLDGSTEARKNLIQYGFSPEESISLLASTAKATGGTGGYQAAGAFSKLLGMDATGLLGSFAQAGQGVKTQNAAEKALTRAVAAGIYSGLDKARLPEFVEGLQSLTGAAGGRAASVINPQEYARVLGLLGKTGLPGLQGSRGVGVAQALDQGFRNPGGGDEGRALVMASLGFGTPSGQTSWYNATKMMQQGLSVNGAGRMRALFRQTDNVYQSQQESNVAIGEMFGLSLDQVEGVRQAFGKKSDREIDQMLKDMTASEKDVLIDIRNILKDSFLDQNRLQAEVADEQITAGDSMHEAMEDMQRILREFIVDVLPAMVRSVNAMLLVLEEMRPLIQGTANVMNDIAEFFSIGRERGTAARKMTTEELATKGGGFSPEELSQLRSDVQGLLELRLAAEEARDIRDAATAAQTFDLSGGGLRPTSFTPRTESQRLQAIVDDLMESPVVGGVDTGRSEQLVHRDRELIQALTRSATEDRRFRSAQYPETQTLVGDVDTQAELRMLLSFLSSVGLHLPASVVRTTPSGDGGSR